MPARISATETIRAKTAKKTTIMEKTSAGKTSAVIPRRMRRTPVAVPSGPPGSVVVLSMVRTYFFLPDPVYNPFRCNHASCNRCGVIRCCPAVHAGAGGDRPWGDKRIPGVMSGDIPFPSGL